MPRGDRWRGDVRAGASNMLSSTGDYPMLSLPHSCTATTHFACHLLPLRLVYGNKLRQLGLRIKLFSQGDGAVNSVGGLQPDTVGGPGSSTTSAITIAGPIKSFWKIFSDSGYVLNWNGEVRVHLTHISLIKTLVAYIHTAQTHKYIHVYIHICRPYFLRPE